MASPSTGAVLVGVGVGFAVGVAATAVVARRAAAAAAERQKEAVLAARRKGVGVDDEEEGETTTTRAGASCGAADSDLMTEQLSRNTLFFGPKGQQKIEAAFVIVVGLGGVGSHACNPWVHLALNVLHTDDVIALKAHMLARAGVGRIRLVDFDNVSLSSLNRHAVATRADVGRPKVRCCADAFAAFNPRCKIEAINEMFTKEQAAALLAGKPGYVIDAIDDVKTKADLLEACVGMGLTVLSALGAGAKSDPTRILIGDLADTTNDPLAIKLRNELKTRAAAAAAAAAAAGGGGSGESAAAGSGVVIPKIQVVFSHEKAKVKLAKLDADQQANPEAYGAVAGMRIRVMPVLGTQPALFGMVAASEVLTRLAGKPLSPRKVEPVSRNFASKLCDRLRQRENKVFGNKPAKSSSDEAEHAKYSPISDVSEVIYICEEMWGSRSAYSGARLESRRVFELARFDRSKPALPYNLLLLTREEAAAHDAATAITGSVHPLLQAAGCDVVGTGSAAVVATGGKHDATLEVLLSAQAKLAEEEAIWVL